MRVEIGPYPEYKDSGISWIGKVPGHWAIVPNRSLFEEIKDQNHDQEEMLSITISRGVIRQRDMLSGTGKKDSSNKDRSKYKLVKPNDIAYNKMRAWQGAFGISRYRGIISPAYIVVRLRDVRNSAKYYHELFRNPLFAKEAERWSYGIASDMWSLRPEDFRNIYVPLPPVKDQAAIETYLTHETVKIDEAIAAKKKVIALLEEEKRTIIQKAVTKGLDSKVKMKDSGVPWIGEIPMHWEVKRLKQFTRCLDSSRTPLSATERGKMKLRQFDYYGASGIIDKVENYIFNEALVLIAEDGANLVLRNLPLALIARGKYWVNNHAHILKPDNGNIEYLASLLESISYHPWISGAAQPKLTQERLMGIPFAVAPDAEQQEIVASFCRQIGPLEIKITHTNKAITLLREYRTRLVADVVTGKLDVRKAAEGLPELDEAELASSGDEGGLESEDEEDLEEDAEA